MPRERYQESLDTLREDVVAMAEEVVGRLEMALEALENDDEDLAMEVIQGDTAINQQYLELEQECIELMALQQPVASDLRFITASFKIITDLERVGDLAVNLGDYTLNTGEIPFQDIDLQALGEQARDIVIESIAAYGADDAEACFEIAESDDDLDAACKVAADTVIRELLASQFDDAGGPAIEALMGDVSNVLLTIRDLERVGDHGVNIAARTLYMVEHDDSLIY